jgi:hypothetical protein
MKTKLMKSIKEKSEDYADEQDLRMAYNGRETIKLHGLNLL